MKRYISKKDRKNNTLMLELIMALGVPSDYKWPITDIEAYPQLKEYDDLIHLLLTTNELIEMLEKENFQWIWGVFSVFHSNYSDKEILDYDLPFIWSEFNNKLIGDDPLIQHPLSILEIDAFDSSYEKRKFMQIDLKIFIPKRPKTSNNYINSKLYLLN